MESLVPSRSSDLDRSLADLDCHLLVAGGIVPLLKTIQEFKDEVGLIRGLKGDNEFSSSAAIKKFCDDNDIRSDTSAAKEEHISNGNKLGIIDRLVRTL
jgi:hypothetical protein